MASDEYTAEQLAMIDWLRIKLTCPTDWKSEIGLHADEDASLDLQTWAWFKAIEKHQVSGTELAAATEFDDFGTLVFAKDLKELTANVAERHDRMLAEYARTMGRLAGLNFLRPSYNGKHFVATATVAEVLKRTKKGGPSLFYEDIEPERMAYWFWTAVDACFALVDTPIDCVTKSNPFVRETAILLWDNVIAGHQIRIVADVLSPIGAVDGIEVSTVAFDIDLSARTVHAYPITEAEAQAIMKKVGVLLVQL
jgi:hypothetical protein